MIVKQHMLFWKVALLKPSTIYFDDNGKFPVKLQVFPPKNIFS